MVAANMLSSRLIILTFISLFQAFQNESCRVQQLVQSCIQYGLLPPARLNGAARLGSIMLKTVGRMKKLIKEHRRLPETQAIVACLKRGGLLNRKLCRSMKPVRAHCSRRASNRFVPGNELNG